MSVGNGAAPAGKVKQAGVDGTFQLKRLAVYAYKAGWIMLIDQAGQVSDGNTPRPGWVIPISKNEWFLLELDEPLLFVFGCQVVFSDTDVLVTLPAVDEMSIDIQGP